MVLCARRLTGTFMGLEDKPRRIKAPRSSRQSHPRQVTEGRRSGWGARATSQITLARPLPLVLIERIDDGDLLKLPIAEAHA